VLPSEKDIAIWKMNCASTENAAVRKSNEDRKHNAIPRRTESIC
jgi:hypothetical protein